MAGALESGINANFLRFLSPEVEPPFRLTYEDWGERGFCAIATKDLHIGRIDIDIDNGGDLISLGLDDRALRATFCALSIETGVVSTV